MRSRRPWVWEVSSRSNWSRCLIISALEIEPSFNDSASRGPTGHCPLSTSYSQSAWLRGNPVDQRNFESANRTACLQCGSSNKDVSEVSVVEKAAVQNRRRSSCAAEVLRESQQRFDDQPTWIQTISVRSSSCHSSTAHAFDSRTSPKCLVLFQSEIDSSSAEQHINGTDAGKASLSRSAFVRHDRLLRETAEVFETGGDGNEIWFDVVFQGSKSSTSEICVCLAHSSKRHSLRLEGKERRRIFY